MCGICGAEVDANSEYVREMLMIFENMCESLMVVLMCGAEVDDI